MTRSAFTMRLAQFQTGARILGAFAVVACAIVLISIVALWRMGAADATTRDLVDNKLARQQLTADLLGLARLNGVRTVAVARSDSLEAGDYFQAQLNAGDKSAAALEARLAALPAAPAERALIDAAAQRKAAWLAVRRHVFQAKDLGKTQEVEQLTAGPLAKTFDAYTGALDGLLAFHTQAARALAAASTGAFAVSRAVLLAVGAVALLLGAVAAGLLTRSIVAPLQDALRLAERVAQGDLSATIAHDRRDEIGRLFDALNAMTGGVSAAVTRVLASAQLIDTASVGMAAGNRDLARRTEEQAASLRVTVGAMAELTDAVRHNHVNAHDASEAALAAAGVARDGAGAVAQMVERMETIRASAARIGAITAIIDGIAFQTNILALNAAVEAARAGAQGRGFAVVAAEVRSLAQHSAAAAKDIKTLIGASSGAIESGAGIARAAGGTMRTVLERVQQVADLLRAIDAASADQAAGIARVRTTVDAMDQATRQNVGVVAQAAQAAALMRTQAERLSAVAAVFKVGDVAAAEGAAMLTSCGAGAGSGAN
jgi:methyl-accepting chemotaxis protein